MSNPYPGEPGFTFGVFCPRRVSFSTLIEAHSPWFSFRVFLPLAFGVSSFHPQGSGGSAYLLAALIR